MESLRFPLFLNLRGKKALVVGCGTVGLRRALTLVEFGARVTVIDPSPPPYPTLSFDVPPPFAWMQRGYKPGDLKDSFLCVAATSQPQVNRQVAEEARELGVLINVADDPSLCQFFFPAICKTEDVVVGLVGDGTDHQKTAEVAEKIRKMLENE